MKKLICSLILSFAWLTSLAMPSISNVKVTPIAPWGMAIDYTVSGAETADAELAFKATTEGGAIYTAKNLSGDLQWSNGLHRVYWNMAKDGISATALNGTVSIVSGVYCVIDLSSGANSGTYPITYFAEPPEGGFNTTEYKTMKLVLKRIEAGTFIMGKDQADETHRVVLTHPFYIGIFEITQKQWELVMGSNPSYTGLAYEKGRYIGDAKPVNQVSYYDIRKLYTMDSVGAESFVGRLQSRTGIDIDLPSKAQWEYACRAGTTTIYSYGDVADGDYMRASGSSPLDVGMTKPNPWGLYDMHGNVWEWSRDIFTDSSHLVYGVDPIGSVSRGSPICCGGSYYWALMMNQRVRRI